MASGLTVSQMMGGKSSGTGPVPTQTFYGSNFIGGPVPKVGSAQNTPGTSLAGQFGSVQPTHVVIVILFLIGLGILLHHFNFEQEVRGSVSAGESGGVS